MSDVLDAYLDQVVLIESTKRAGGRLWTDEEDEYLEEMAGIISDAEIAENLGRTECAVHVRRERERGLPSQSKHPAYITANRAASLLGLDAHKVCGWIDCGIMPGERIDTVFQATRRVLLSVFYRWMQQPLTWLYVDVEKIVNPHVRAMVARCQAEWGDEWWDTNQVADYHGVDKRVVNRHANLGRVPGVRVTNLGGRASKDQRWGYWYFRKSDAVHFKFVTRPKRKK